MANIHEYYQKLSEDILTYIKEKQYEKALEIIEMELEQPYIPQEHYVNLLNSKQEIENMMNESIYENEIKGLSKLQIWDRIHDVKHNKIDLVYLNLFLSRFENELDATDMSIMQKIFNDKKLPNTEKTILVSCLADINVNHDFDYYNPSLKKSFTFNPTQLANLNATKKSETIFPQLEKHYLKDPSKLQIAASLLQVLIIETFPDEFNFDEILVKDTIINMVDSLFNQTKILDNEVSKILKPHIGYQDEK